MCGHAGLSIVLSAVFMLDSYDSQVTVNAYQTKKMVRCRDWTEKAANVQRKTI